MFKAIVAAVVALSICHPFMSLKRKIFVTFRDYGCLPERKLKEITRITTVSKLIATVLTAMFVILGYLILPLGGSSKKLYFAVWFIEEKLSVIPYAEPVCKLYYYVLLVSFLYLMVSETFGVMYFVLHIVFQTNLLVAFINNISADFNNDIRLCVDEKYQKIIRHRLTYCIKFHQDIRE